MKYITRLSLSIALLLVLLAGTVTLLSSLPSNLDTNTEAATTEKTLRTEDVAEMSDSVQQENHLIHEDAEDVDQLHRVNDDQSISTDEQDELITKSPQTENVIGSQDISVQSSPGFISTWDTTLTSSGSSNSSQISLPLESSGTYDFTVDWNDSSTDTITSYNQTEVTHNYTTTGVYTLNITGTIEGWRFNNGGDKLKIVEISQWGDLNFGNSDSYFYAFYEMSKNLHLHKQILIN